MPAVERFLEETATELRRAAQHAGLAERRMLDDRIALLTDHRSAALDEPQFERLLAHLRAGRSPVRLFAARPEAIAEELAARWLAYRTPALTGAR